MIEVNMQNEKITDIIKQISEHCKNEIKQIKLIFNYVCSAKTFFKDGRLPLLEMPPIAIIIIQLEGDYNLNFECIYEDEKTHAILSPIETSALQLLRKKFQRTFYPFIFVKELC